VNRRSALVCSGVLAALGSLGAGAQTQQLDEDYHVSSLSGGNFTYVRMNGMPRSLGVMFDYSFRP
jgi:hypothetical protein